MDRFFRGIGSRLRGESQQEAAAAEGTRDLDRSGATVERVSDLPKRDVERMMVADEDVTTFTDEDSVDISAEDDASGSEESSSGEGYWSYHGEEGGWVWVGDEGSEPEGDPPSWPRAEDNPGVPTGGYWLMPADESGEPVWVPGPDGSLPNADSIPGDGSGYWANVGGQQVWVDGSVNADAAASGTADTGDATAGDPDDDLEDVAGEVVADDQTEDGEGTEYTITPGEGYVRPDGTVWFGEGDATVTIGTGNGDSISISDGSDASGGDENDPVTGAEEPEPEPEPDPEPEPEPEQPADDDDDVVESIRRVDVGDLDLSSIDLSNLGREGAGQGSGSTGSPTLSPEDLRVSPELVSRVDLSRYLTDDDDDEDDDEVAQDHLIEKPVIEYQRDPSLYPPNPVPKAGENLDALGYQAAGDQRLIGDDAGLVEESDPEVLRTQAASADLDPGSAEGVNSVFDYPDFLDVQVRDNPGSVPSAPAELGGDEVFGIQGVGAQQGFIPTGETAMFAAGDISGPASDSTTSTGADERADEAEASIDPHDMLDVLGAQAEAMPGMRQYGDNNPVAPPGDNQTTPTLTSRDGNDLTNVTREVNPGDLDFGVASAAREQDDAEQLLTPSEAIDSSKLDFKVEIAGGASPDAAELTGDELFPVVEDASGSGLPGEVSELAGNDNEWRMTQESTSFFGSDGGLADTSLQDDPDSSSVIEKAGLVGDEVSAYQDAVATEAYLPTGIVEPTLEFKNAGGNYNNAVEQAEEAELSLANNENLTDVEFKAVDPVSDFEMEDALGSVDGDDDDGLDGI